MTGQVFAVLAAAGLITAGAVAADTRSASALPLAMMAQATGGGTCEVVVNRTGTPGVAEVVRTETESQCICTITTGAADVNGSAEAIVQTVQRDKECRDDAVAGAVVGGGAAGGAAGAAGGAAGGAAAGGAIAGGGIGLAGVGAGLAAAASALAIGATGDTPG